LISIILIGSLWRFYYSHIAVIRGDETLYMYQSYLITEGMVPFKDFYCRSPVYLYFLAFVMAIFGKSMVGVRFGLVLVSTFNIFLVYLLGKKIDGRKTGIYAAAFFAFSPYNIRIGSMLVTEVLLTMLLTLVTLVVLKALMESRYYLLIIAGIITALSIFVRRTGVIFLIVVPLFILAYHLVKKDGDRNLKKIVFKSFKISCIFDSSVVVIGILIYFLFVSLTSWSYMNESFFVGKPASFDVHQFPDVQFITAIPGDVFYYSFFSVLFFMLFLFCVLGRSLEKRDLVYQIHFPLGMFLVYYFITPFRQPPREIMTGELFELVFIIILVGAAIPLRVFQKVNQRHPGSQDLIHTIIFILSAFVIIEHLQYYDRLWSQIIIFIAAYAIMEISFSRLHDLSQKSERKDFFDKLHFDRIYEKRFIGFCLLVFSFFLFIDESIYNQQEKTFLNLCFIFSFPLMIFLIRFIKISRFSLIETLVIVWFFPFFILYVYWGHALDFYYYELMVPVSLGAGFILKRLLKDVPKKYDIHLRSLISIALISILLSNSITINTIDQQNEKGLVSPETSEEVAGYLEDRTVGGEEVLTADLSIVISAGLRVPFNISDPFYYRRPSAFPSGETINYPSLEELQDHMLQKPVRYCVVGPSTINLYFDFNPEFESFVKEHYEIEKTIVNVDIYKIKGEYL